VLASARCRRSPPPPSCGRPRVLGQRDVQPRPRRARRGGDVHGAALGGRSLRRGNSEVGRATPREGALALGRRSALREAAGARGVTWPRFVAECPRLGPSKSTSWRAASAHSGASGPPRRSGQSESVRRERASAAVAHLSPPIPARARFVESRGRARDVEHCRASPPPPLLGPLAVGEMSTARNRMPSRSPATAAS